MTKGVYTDIHGLRIKRILVKDGKVMPGLPGFIPKGNGKTSCYFCGKDLTDQLSFARGVGPECIKMRGPMPSREWIEEYASDFKAYQSAQKRLNLPIKSFEEWLPKAEST